MQTLGTIVRPLTQEVFACLGECGAVSSGPPPEPSTVCLGATIDTIRVWDVSAVMATAWVDDWNPEEETAEHLHKTATEVLSSRPACMARHERSGNGCYPAVRIGR